MTSTKFASFATRVRAGLIDSALIAAIIWPSLTYIYGIEYWTGDKWFFGTWDLLLTYVFPSVFILACWLKYSSSPGKYLLKIKIVDSATMQSMSARQVLKRYLASFPAFFAFGLGYFAINKNDKKQGWHDSWANTIVIHH